MHKYYLQGVCALLISLLCFSASAQQDINDVGAAKIDKLKAEGKLTGKEQFTNRNATPNPMRVSAPSANQMNTQTSCKCWIDRDTSFHIVHFDGSGGSGGPGLPPDFRNDDWSTVLLTLPFNICFYGSPVNQVYINNNGNVSIGSPYSTFTADSFPSNQYQMIAPFWADVDTRDTANSGLVYASITPTHMIVQWEEVGYYSQQGDKLNTFQLIITNGVDPILPPNQNVAFCYKDMQWTTGSASGGVNGFGGTAATVGINQGNGSDYIQFGLFDTAGSVYDGPFGAHDGVDWLDNQSFTINACISSANIPPVLNSANVCDTIHLCENTVYSLTANYLSPEQNEITTINTQLFGMTGVNILSNTPGNTATVVLEITGQTSNLGFHTINATAIDNGNPPGATSSNFVIEVMPAPLPSFTFAPASPVQANSLVTFTNTTGTMGTLYTWDFGDGSPTSTNPSPTHTYPTAGTYTVSLTAMFPNGCSTVVTQQIVITSCTPATFTVTNVCAGSGSTVTYTGVAGATAIFTWNFAGANVISGSGSGPYSLSWNNAGSYNISLTVNEATCSSSVTMPVNIYAVPTASMTSVPQLCVGDTPNINFTGTAGAGANYTWSFGNATILSGAGSGPYGLQFNTAGQVLINLIIDENGCSDTVQQTIQVNPIPNALFTIPAVACANDPLNVNYTGSAGAGATYNWDFNGANVVSGSGQGPYDVNWSTGGNYNVTLTVTENGCTSPPINMPVAVTALPVVTVTSVAPLCEGQTANVDFTGTAGASANYTWNFGNAIVVSGTGSGPYVLQWNTPGQQQIQLSVDENNCTASTVQNVTVNAIPTSDFVVNNAACVNQPITLNYTGTATSGASYNWYFGVANVIAGTNQGPYTLSWGAQGSYQVTLTVTENGCVSPQTDLFANVNPLPIVFAGLDQTLCSGTATSIGSPANPGETYQWSPVTNLSSVTVSNPSLTPVNQTAVDQQYDYILMTTDANGCINTDTVAVTAYAEPVVNFPHLPFQCIEGNNFVFSALSNINSGVNYNWAFSPQASQLTSTNKSVAITYSTIGTFPVMLTGDYNNCPAQPYIDSVTVYEMPVPNFAPIVTQGCKPLNVPFTNLSAGNGNNYHWDFGDGATDEAALVSHNYIYPGTYDVYLSAVNVHGCAADTLYKNLIRVFDDPHGQFIPNPPVANILAPIIQFQNYSTNVLTYVWDFGDSTATSTIVNPSHTYGAIGSYPITLMVVSPDGCIDTITGLVSVEDNFSFYIPQVFTPNGDGVNDFFRGYGIAFDKYALNIYTRWGELIFKSNNYEQGWDGTLNSEMVQNATYIYRFEIVDQHGEVHTYVGDVSVVY